MLEQEMKLSDLTWEDDDKLRLNQQHWGIGFSHLVGIGWKTQE